MWLLQQLYWFEYILTTCLW